MTMMTFEHMKIAVVLAWAIICTIVAVTFVSSAGNWPLVVGSALLSLLMILWTCHPPMRPAFARMPRK